MMDIIIWALLAANAFFVVGTPTLKIRAVLKDDDNVLTLKQSFILTLLGWGICAVMLTMLILKLTKPSSWPNNPVYMYVTIAITLIGSLITLRSLLLEVRVKEKGLEIRTILKKRAFYDYRDIEIDGKCSNQMVSVSSRRGHLCTLSAKGHGIATMIRRWHEATW